MVDIACAPPFLDSPFGEITDLAVMYTQNDAYISMIGPSIPVLLTSGEEDTTDPPPRPTRTTPTTRPTADATCRSFCCPTPPICSCPQVIAELDRLRRELARGARASRYAVAALVPAFHYSRLERLFCQGNAPAQRRRRRCLTFRWPPGRERTRRARPSAASRRRDHGRRTAAPALQARPAPWIAELTARWAAAFVPKPRRPYPHQGASGPVCVVLCERSAQLLLALTARIAPVEIESGCSVGTQTPTRP